ncbi:hypothetical protein BOO86_15170 [Mycobacterium sp. CBMA 234]|uniref:hypothetical protein n=1 Tax=Mycolicibacterium sp. CBMA 234 TaxID=1918495 RepID=UPI0012DBDC01|nr:hypothetical protein [Mycolicibacterium sp. CBMA 234]MUL65814.1 hypothetical protein [Mycolicibacterium sp. CBMA 234]
MAPVETHGIDQPVNEIGQLISTALTFGLAVAAVVYCVVIWRREGSVWQFFLLISGGLTSLMEPLYDHLYGLWFFEQGQWHLYTTFGSNQPIWVPAAYLAFYGGASVFVARYMMRKPTMRSVWMMYGAIAAMSLAAEMSYVTLLKVYAYQDSQPFVVGGYPVFLAFTNACSALIGGLIVFGLVPVLRRPIAQASLITVVPGAFAMGLFGTGIVYLSVRHGFQHPPMWLVHLAALTVVGGIALTVRTLGFVTTTAYTAESAAANPVSTDHSVTR